MLTAVGGYLWWRLVHGTTRPRSAGRLFGTIIAVIVVMLGPSALIGQYALPIPVQRVIGWPGWLCYAFVVFLAVATLLTEPVRLFWWWRRRHATPALDPSAAAVNAGPSNAGSLNAGSSNAGPSNAGPSITGRSHAEPQSPERRLFLRRCLAGGIGVAAVIATGFGARTAVGDPNVRRQRIAIVGLPPQAAGMRIALVSDLHLGSINSVDFCRGVVELVNSQQPDIVLLVGDLTDGTAAELGADLRPLADLRSPEGTYFVTGNHEFYFDPDGWLALIPQLGIRVLANEGVNVRGLLLAGVHDIYGKPTGRGPDMDAALQTRVDGQPVLMMSHSPNLVYDAADRGVDLMVSGHTHGGQFYPAKWLVQATSAALSGLYRFGQTQVFVTNGAGFWGPISRLGVPPDITIIELVQPGSS
jgi:predicted MPP superfamily phosphohydrolase